MRVPRTFVFVDISGFTNFTNENGDDAAGRLLASWRAVTRDVASGAACAPLSIRVGMASGLALLFEGDDYIGTAVNLAARLCDAAEPFEILFPSEHIENLPEGVIVTAHVPMSLRGLNEAIPVVSLTGEATNAARNDTGELWTRSPFVL